MAATGFSLLLAAVSALACLAAVALPVEAGTGDEAAGAAAPVSARILDVPPHELSDRARPAEPPPPDFTAAQYIDSAGCVFLRADGGWRARVGRDGTAICGYPPSFTARRTGPDGAAPLFRPPQEPTDARLHRQLVEAIIPNLQSGELADGDASGMFRGSAMTQDALASTSADRPAATGTGTAAARPAPDVLGLAAMVDHASEISRQMAGPSRIDRLCALIGGPPDGSPADGAGGLGVCPASPGALPGLAVVAQASRNAGARDPEIPRVRAVGTATGKAAVAGGMRQPARATDGDGKTRASPAAAANMGAAGGLVPSGARYVQLRGLGDPEAADRAARDLASQGVPVVRSRQPDGQVRPVLVGPLDGREAVVRMIDRLRRAGYRELVARQ